MTHTETLYLNCTETNEISINRDGHTNILLKAQNLINNIRIRLKDKVFNEEVGH